MQCIDRIHTFTSNIERLKSLMRFSGQYGWKDYPVESFYDSVASHSWRLATMVMMIAPHLSKPFNVEKAIKMALIHDLPEIIAGDDSPMGKDCTGQDTHAYNEAIAEQRFEKERKAAKELFTGLPKEQSLEWFDLWLECEKLESFESQIIKALDKIEATFQVFEYQEGHMYPEHFEFSIKYCMKYAYVDPAIEAYGQSIVDRMKAAYKPYE